MACVTVIAGKVIGDPTIDSPLMGSTIQVIGHVTSTDYGTTTLAASGTYAMTIDLTPSDTQVDVYVTGPGARFQTGVTTRFVTAGRVNVVPPISATPATGYAYLQGGTAGCQFPVKASLTMVDSVHGTSTFDWTSVFSLCRVLTTFNAGSCGVRNTPVDFVFGTTTMWLRLDWSREIAGCVVVSSCPNPRSPFQQSVNIPNTLITSKTCPDAGSTLFDCTWTIPANAIPLFYGPSVQTIHIYET